jgi:PadR family transcriptional regulator PadR
MSDTLGSFEQAVLLAVVRLGSGAYGRAILHDVQARLEREVAPGAVHATLDRLERKRLLRSRIESGTAVRGGRARRFYRLEALGVQSLNEARAAVDTLWSGLSYPLHPGQRGSP